MKCLLVPLIALPLAACSIADDFEIPTVSSVTSLFAPVGPETRPLTASIAPVRRPSANALSSMTVTDLKNGSRKTYAVKAYGNGVRVSEGNGCIWTRAGDWFSPSDSWSNCGSSGNWHTGQARVRELDSLYPLRVGSVGSYQRSAVSHTGRSYSRTTRCKVTDAVEVLRQAQAATPAYVVRCDDSRRVRTTWYAPGEGPIAYREVHRRNGLEEAWVRSK